MGACFARDGAIIYDFTSTRGECAFNGFFIAVADFFVKEVYGILTLGVIYFNSSCFGSSEEALLVFFKGATDFFFE